MKTLIALLLSVCIIISCEGTKKNNRQVTASIKSLEGRWDVFDISGTKTSFSELYPNNKPFIKFDLANNTISGRTSCNSFSGSLVIKEATLDLTGPLAMTKMFCPGGGEAAFSEALPKITSYLLQDSTLLLLAGTTISMRLKKESSLAQ